MDTTNRQLKILLASKSPRRVELMRQAGFDPVVLPSLVEEHITQTDPEEVVKELSRQKAEDVACVQYPKACEANGWEREQVLVLGADTIVVLDGTIMGKPADEEQAFAMLRTLSGRAHQVYTGVTILETDGISVTKRDTFAVCTKVHVAALSDEEIRAYIATGDPMDKAGAYGIQGIFARHIQGIEGDYNNVVGLPIAEVYRHINLR